MRVLMRSCLPRGLAPSVARRRTLLTVTVNTFNPCSRQVSLQAVVKGGLPAGMKVYPGGATASKEICGQNQYFNLE